MEMRNKKFGAVCLVIALVVMALLIYISNSQRHADEMGNRQFYGGNFTAQIQAIGDVKQEVTKLRGEVEEIRKILKDHLAD